MSKKNKKKPYKDIIDFASRQLGESSDESWDLSTPEGLKLFEERCSRRVYKSTACGAWLAFMKDAPIETTMRTFRVCLATGKRGTEITQVRELFKDGFDLLGDTLWPEEFKLFMSLKPWPGYEQSFEPLSKMSLDVIGIRANPMKQYEEGHEVLERKASTMVLKVQVRCRQEKKQKRPLHGVYGIRIGSIVEGSDAEVEGGEWLFPFTEAQYENAIADVEAEVDRLWHEANGGEEE